MNRHKKLAVLAVIFSFFSVAALSHNLRGTITDKEGNPISYATIFVKNLNLGTTTNEEGKFELDIEPGTYEVNFRCLGYKPKNEILTITKEVETVSVIMEVQILEIQEVTVSAGGEDPAYGIMRKVIGLSYVHLNQITSYTADVYIRGTVKFHN